MLTWLHKFLRQLNPSHSFRTGTEADKMIATIITRSAHHKSTDVISEAIGVVTVIYEEAQLGHTVLCAVEHGKIVLYVNDPDDGETNPKPAEATNLIRLYPRAA